MAEKEHRYYVVTRNAIPEVLLKVVEAKRLLEGEKALSVMEAVSRVGLSRSSFYKYRDDIFEFHENARGKTITFVLEMRDEPGLLSDVLKVIADCRANILTIHQSIPTSGVAQTTISVEVLPTTEDISLMIEQIERESGVHSLRILGAESS